MTKEPLKPLSYLAPLFVLLALIGAFFWGSRNPSFPKSGSDTEYESVTPVSPQVDVWVSDRLFSWDEEPPRPLEELPAGIREFKIKHRLIFASVSGDEKTRFNETVLALDELRKGDFNSCRLKLALNQNLITGIKFIATGLPAKRKRKDFGPCPISWLAPLRHQLAPIR